MRQSDDHKPLVACAYLDFPGQLKTTPTGPGDYPRIGLGMNLPPLWRRLASLDASSPSLPPCNALLPHRWLNCALFGSDGANRIDAVQSPHCLQESGAVNCVQMYVPVSMLDSCKHLGTSSKHPNVLAHAVIRHCRKRPKSASLQYWSPTGNRDGSGTAPFQSEEVRIVRLGHPQ